MSQSNGTGRKSAPEPDAVCESIVAEALSACDERHWRAGGRRNRRRRLTLADLDAAREDSRALLDVETGNEFAWGCVENRQNYAVGDGLNYEAVAAPGVAADPGLLAAVTQFISAFGELNDLSDMEAESVLRLDRDGDALIRLFPGDGIPEARFVEPEWVRPPAGPPPWFDLPYHPDPWKWGVVTRERDRKVVLGYWVCEDKCEPEFVPERDLTHLYLNTDSSVPRGWPTFSPIADDLRRCEELLVAMTATTKAQAKIALIRKQQSLSREKADAILARLTKGYQEQADGTRREVTIEELPYGTMYRVPAGDEIQFPTGGQPASGQIEVLQANLRAAAARVVMPEWMFSQLVDAKYSNAFVSEAPPLKAFKKLQKRLVRGFGEGRLRQGASLLWRAVRMAVRANLLPAAVLTTVVIKCTAPTLEIRDKASEASENSTYITAGVKPIPLVQQELGYDPAELAKLAQKYPAPAAPGTPPATPPAPAADGSGGQAPAPAAPAPTAEALARLFDGEGGEAAAAEFFRGWAVRLVDG